MNIHEFLDLCKEGNRRYHLVGDASAGVITVLDLEGRLFTVLEKEVLNRVNPDAFIGESSAQQYLNPGGDALWPGPEGGELGYHYTTGSWRVPPAISSLRYRVVHAEPGKTLIRAEVDLVNDIGIGIPTIFEREIAVSSENNALTVSVVETITYIGTAPLPSSRALLVPWTLCQFSCGPACKVSLPVVPVRQVSDFYEPSNSLRWTDGVRLHTKTEGNQRYQIGLSSDVEWIEYTDPSLGLTVRRTADELQEPFRYRDIADRPPDKKPGSFETRYSVYNDANGFMEIEAAGGCPDIIEPGMKLSLVVLTEYSRRTG